MDAEIGFLKALLEGVHHLQVVGSGWPVLGAVGGDGEAQLSGDVATAVLIQAGKAPGPASVEATGEVPGDAIELHGRIEIALKAAEALAASGKLITTQQPPALYTRLQLLQGGDPSASES